MCFQPRTGTKSLGFSFQNEKYLNARKEKYLVDIHLKDILVSLKKGSDLLKKNDPNGGGV